MTKITKIFLIVVLVALGISVFAFYNLEPNKVKADASEFYSETFEANLTPEQEVEFMSTTTATSTMAGRGTAQFNLTRDGQSLVYHISVNNLSSSRTGTHLHCASYGKNGPVVVPLAELDGTITMNAIQSIGMSCSPNIQTLAHLVQAMREGQIYVNVHTAQFPAGETRGQIFRSNVILDFSNTVATTTATTTTPIATSTTPVVATTSPSGWYYVFVEPDAYYKIQGSSVRFMGSHFVPNETVTISTSGVADTTTIADSNGNVATGWLLVPYNVGMRTYIFTGSSSNIPFSVGINVGNANPWIVLSTYYAAQGTPLTITGNQFGAGETVSVWFNTILIGSVVTDMNGRFSLMTTVPNAGAGQWTVIAKGATTNMTASQSFSQSQ